MTMFRNPIPLEEGWAVMQKGIDKLINIIEEHPDEGDLSSVEYMTLYTTAYNMCTQKPPYDFSRQLYDKYRRVLVEYIMSTVLPSLKKNHGELMLRELVKRWKNHKDMVRWLSYFFNVLDRTFVVRRSLPTLNEVGLICFRDLVLEEMKGKLRDAVMSLIDQEREGMQIDRDLLKNVSDIFVELGQQIDVSLEENFKNLKVNDSGSGEGSSSVWAE